jgi:hypothetical protein
MFYTTDAATRNFDVVSVPDSISGLAIQPPFAFLGLAVSAHLTVHAEDAVALTCAHSDVTRSAQYSGSAYASCDIPPALADDDWHISLEVTGGKTRDLGVIVPGFRNIVLSAPGDSAVPDPISRKVVSFDAVLTTSDVREMPRLGDGLTFHNLVVAHRRFYGGPGYVNCVTSGEYLAYTSSGHPATITKSGGYTPVSMELGYAWDGARSGHAILEGYLNGKRVHRVRLNLSAGYPVTFMPRWGRVDQLVLRHSTYWQVLVDDFTYTD